MADILTQSTSYQGTVALSAPVSSDPVYEPRAVFSINASNQLQGTLWLVKNGVHVQSSLGTASYTIRDKDGSSIGITQSGIAADGNGLYKITAVSAALIQDLTHYVVEINISVDSVNRRGQVGITLGE